MKAPDAPRTFSFFENLPIQIKAFAASAVLLICLISLGAIAYVTLDKSENNLHTLSSTILPKQSEFALVSDNIVAIHMKTFRYVSWASNGINDALLRSLSAEIASDLRNINLDLETLAARSDLSAKEKLDLKNLISKWKEYESSALDTIEVGSTDAAMATMMLGQTDDKFTAVANDFKSMANSVAAATNTISTKLYTDAAQKKVILAIGAIIGLLLSIVATVLLSRSIVTPIQSVTNVMRRLSSGDTEVEIGYRGRSDEIGQMVEAINVFRKNTIEMRAMEIENLETEKKNLREIGEARARLTDAIETISEGFSLYDVDDKLVIFNSKYKSLFSAHADVIEPGTTFEKIVRTAVQRGMIDDAEGGHEAWLAERTAQHKAPTSAHIQHRSDGRWIQVSERKTAAGGVVATYADITELKQREAELAAARDAAEATLRNLRTAQDRLIQTEKLASLGQLTAGIAHEIKNPLNFVNNFSAISVELIDELRGALAGANLDNKLRAEIGEIADMLQGNLEKVVQHGKRADAIVKNMLLHSRQGSGEHRPVDINAVVEESLNLAYHGARAEKQGFNITLESSFDPAAGEVDLFPQEITRVLLNLISNGFYAATKRKVEANGGQHEPTLAAVTKNLGDSVEIRIRDNGMGIPPEIKEKMFNPFFTTKPVGEGTGLGLSISHDIIVKQHGGSIEVDTQLGEFTEFRIVLPRGAATIAKSGERP
jgi:signal transduction histidine kinase/HAMP domain-containing protein